MFWGNLENLYVGVPLPRRVGALSYGKSWIRPWLQWRIYIEIFGHEDPLSSMNQNILKNFSDGSRIFQWTINLKVVGGGGGGRQPYYFGNFRRKHALVADLRRQILDGAPFPPTSRPNFLHFHLGGGDVGRIIDWCPSCGSCAPVLELEFRNCF